VNNIRNLALGALSTCIVAAAPSSVNADTIQLGFILDRTGSIGSTDWNTIVDGLSSAVGSWVPFGGTDTCEVSFASSASIDISNVLVTDAASRTALALSFFNLGDGRPSDVYALGGATNYAAAFTSLNTVLSNTTLGATTFVRRRIS
jgi:hypothetical protein